MQDCGLVVNGLVGVVDWLKRYGEGEPVCWVVAGGGVEEELGAQGGPGRLVGQAGDEPFGRRREVEVDLG